MRISDWSSDVCSSDLSGAKSASLRYDPLGRLYEVTGASGTTRFLYDGDELVAEYSSSGTVLRRYVHGPGVDEPMVWYEGAAASNATRRYLHANHQGSIVAVANASGAGIAIKAYRSEEHTTELQSLIRIT